MALVMPRTSYYPYTYWYLRAVSDTEVLLDVEGPLMTFKFSITPGYLQFLDKTGASELNCLKGLILPPGELLLKMQQCGLHLIPSKIDY